MEPLWSHLKRSLANLAKHNLAQLTTLVFPRRFRGVASPATRRQGISTGPRPRRSGSERGVRRLLAGLLALANTRWPWSQQAAWRWGFIAGKPSPFTARVDDMGDFQKILPIRAALVMQGIAD